jgi:pimeloyl-ACP methyl ester carboxylesterase
MTSEAISIVNGLVMPAVYMSVMTRLAQPLAIVAVVLAATWLGTTGLAPLLEPLEQRLLFSPLPVDAARLHFAAPGVEQVRIATPDGVTLHGWLKRPARKKFPLVIVYGGVRREVSEFVRRAPAGEWGWLVVNYRGFGLSEGSPSERTVVEDAKRIYDWAAERPDVEASNIVVLGRSLGSYVAVSVAAARRARAAILATPFDSFVALGETRFPQLPVDWLIGGRYDSAALAPRISVPALFVLAEKDDITPAEHGRALARAWGGRTRTVTLRGAGHGGIERRDEFWRSVTDYLRLIRPTVSSVRESSRSR